MLENPPSAAEDGPSNGPTRVATASEIAGADSDLDAELEEMAVDLLSTDSVELARWTEGTLQEIERRDDSSLRSLPVLDAQLVADMVRWIPDDCSREAQFSRTEDWRRAFAGDRTRSGETRSIEDSINTLERARSPRTPTASPRTLDLH